MILRVLRRGWGILEPDGDMLPLLPTLLFACGGTKVDDVGANDDTGAATDSADSGDTGAAPCGVEVIATTPEEGTTGVGLGGRVSFTLSAPDPTARVTMRLGDTDVPGESWFGPDGAVVWFEAAGPLVADADYTATVDTCGADAGVSFRTRPLGAPVSDLDGTAYLVDIAGAAWVNPPNFGAMLGVVLDPKLLIGVAHTSGDALSWIAAPSLDGETQNWCRATTAFPDADFAENPFFQIGPADVGVTLGGVDMDLHRFKLSGEFVGGGISGGVVAVGIDIRQVLPAVADLVPIKDADGFCEKVGGFGITCLPCPDGTGAYCVDLYAEELGAAPVPAGLEVVSQSDCHPSCGASWENPACDTSGF